MCTVTFFPRPGGGFILSSNRDESPERGIAGIVQRKGSSGTIVYPQDALAGGTWIAADSGGRVLCLLNGAFDRHERRLPYRKSRGLLVLELIDEPNIPASFQDYDLEGIEPFTIIMAEGNALWELCWDGSQRYLQQRDAGTRHIWSSSTLYGREARMRRAQWLEDWFKDSSEYTREAAMDFHREAGKEDLHDGLIMDRGGIVQTVSISQLVAEKGNSCFYYFELENRIPVLRSQISI